MTNEQAIEFLETIKNEIADNGAIETVLNLLKEKDAEIEKKEKIMDLMTELIDEISEKLENTIDVCETMESINNCEISCKECIKQYFERMATND